MSGSAPSLYDVDFVRWLDQQASALREAGRAGTNLPLDWENLAEEIAALGRSDRRELRSRLITILLHLTKLRLSSAEAPRAGWKATVARERLELLGGVLGDSPSLRAQVADLIAELTPKAVALAAGELSARGELSESARSGLASVRYTEAQILGDWFPDAPERGA